jgi:hypothetical protein
MENYFADFESDLDAPGLADQAARSYLGDAATFARATRQSTAPIVDCPKCRGTGKFVTWSGRDGGNCHKCDGSGKTRGLKMDATSVQRREHAAERREEQRQQAQQERRVWCEAHADVLSWINARAERGNTFAQSLSESFQRFDSLTVNQVAAVRRCIAQDAERSQQRAAAAPSVAGEGTSKLMAAFEAAKAAGLKSPKVRVGGTQFSCARVTSANAGCLYVKAGETYLGKVTPAGKFFASRDCSPEQAAEVARVLIDPMGEAVAHGKRTGSCAICARELTDPVSVERGIGPICAENFGW